MFIGFGFYWKVRRVIGGIGLGAIQLGSCAVGFIHHAVHNDQDVLHASRLGAFGVERQDCKTDGTD